MTSIQLCQDDDTGYIFGIALPDGAEDCTNGPILGPPIGLDKKIHNLLANAHIFNAFDLLNNRVKLMELLRDAGLPKEYARTVTNVYQRQYFKKEDE